MNYISTGEKKLIDILIELINNEIDAEHLTIDEESETYYEIFIERSSNNKIIEIMIDSEQKDLKNSSVVFSLEIDEDNQKNIQIKERKVRDSDGKSYNITRQFKTDSRDLSDFSYTINQWSKSVKGIVTCQLNPLYFYDSNNDTCYYLKSATESISLDKIKEKFHQMQEELQKYLGPLYKTSKIKEGFVEQETLLQRQKYFFKEGNESILRTNRKWSNLENAELSLIADTIAKKIFKKHVEGNEDNNSSQIQDSIEIMTELTQEKMKKENRRAALIEKMVANPEYLKDILDIMPSELLFMFENMAAEAHKNSELVKKFK